MTWQCKKHSKRFHNRCNGCQVATAIWLMQRQVKDLKKIKMTMQERKLVEWVKE